MEECSNGGVKSNRAKKAREKYEGEKYIRPNFSIRLVQCV